MAALKAAETDLRHCGTDSRIEDFFVGVWDWDVVNDQIYSDSSFALMFGVDAEDAARGQPLNVWLNAIHPNDLDTVIVDIEKAKRGQLFSREYRIVTKGETHWVHAHGKCTLDKDGNAVRFPGALLDISHRRPTTIT
ncbi:PAS domain-containing protein [Tardiphaga sp.]|uniref:PAS domain-containing protein n=1 Tax=Tardiphaga sp. TaxID=1926292 RepID=UPI002633646E|nr:PAS domain-containing protein [Tardiphaga sp.]